VHLPARLEGHVAAVVGILEAGGAADLHPARQVTTETGWLAVAALTAAAAAAVILT
jgi:hypothetical protein